MNVPDVYDVSYNQRDYEPVWTERHNDIVDVLESLRKYRATADIHHVTITSIVISPAYLDQAPIPGMVR